MTTKPQATRLASPQPLLYMTDPPSHALASSNFWRRGRYFHCAYQVAHILDDSPPVDSAPPALAAMKVMRQLNLDWLTTAVGG
jgi:hypothetical protein